MNNEFFPPRPEANPTIYAYELVGVETHKGLLKVGFTNRNSKDRIAEQLKTSRIKYKIIFELPIRKRISHRRRFLLPKRKHSNQIR